jgi:hypothetical protein
MPFVQVFEGPLRPDMFGTGFSVSEARRLMAAVPRDTAAEIVRARNNVAHGHPGSYSSFVSEVKHSLVAGSGAERTSALRALAARAPGTRFAQACTEAAERITAFNRFTAAGDDRIVESAQTVILMLVADVMRVVLDTWRETGGIATLDAQQESLSAGNDRARRVLRAARIPLWVMRALSGVDVENLRLMTAEDLVDRAGLSRPVAPRFSVAGEPSPEALLADAESALRLVRFLAMLRVPPAVWNDFLEGLAGRLEATADTIVSKVGEVPVPPRPCHPPGELVMSEPRVPRAPGAAVPRDRTDRGRSRLHRCGGRRGRSAA